MSCWFLYNLQVMKFLVVRKIEETLPKFLQARVILYDLVRDGIRYRYRI